MKTLKHAVPALLALAIMPAFAPAATIDDCQAIQDRLARYACYDTWDAASGTVRQSAPRATPAPQSGQQGEASEFGRVTARTADEDEAREQPQVTIGSSEPAVSDFGRNQADARVIEGSEGTELIDRIAALEQLGPSRWLITLAGGQQWRQMLSKRYNLNVGDEIRIYPTRWGSSYRLTSEVVGSFIQVERVDALATSRSNDMPAPRAQAPQPPQAPEAERERSLLGRIFNRDDESEPQQASTAEESTVEGFGRAQSEARVLEGTNGKSELMDTIAALQQRGPSMWVITLSGGQKWQQMISKRYPLEVGDEVRIYPSRWGSSYRLSSPDVGSFIQVQRVD